MNYKGLQVLASVFFSPAEETFLIPIPVWVACFPLCGLIITHVPSSDSYLTGWSCLAHELASLPPVDHVKWQRPFQPPR